MRLRAVAVIGLLLGFVAACGDEGNVLELEGSDLDRARPMEGVAVGWDVLRARPISPEDSVLFLLADAHEHCRCLRPLTG